MGVGSMGAGSLGAWELEVWEDGSGQAWQQVFGTTAHIHTVTRDKTDYSKLQMEPRCIWRLAEDSYDAAMQSRLSKRVRSVIPSVLFHPPSARCALPFVFLFCCFLCSEYGCRSFSAVL